MKTKGALLAVIVAVWAIGMLLGPATTPARADPALSFNQTGQDWFYVAWPQETYYTYQRSFDLNVTAMNGSQPTTIYGVWVAVCLPGLPKADGNPVPGLGNAVMTATGAGPQTSFQYGIPLKGDGKPLTHEIYNWAGGGPNAGAWYSTIYIGDVTGSKSVHVDISGFTDTPLWEVHFDAYNHVYQSKRSVFVPFSHDVASTVPEPGSLALLATGALGLLPLLRRRRTT